MSAPQNLTTKPSDPITLQNGNIIIGECEISGLTNPQFATLHRLIGNHLDAVSRDLSRLGPAWKDLVTAESPVGK